MKTCQRCNVDKLPMDFHKNKRQIDGLHPVCVACRGEYYKKNKQKLKPKPKESSKKYRDNNKEKIKNYYLIQRFGISLEQFNTMAIKQNNVCKICSNVENGRALAVDHCHKTGQIRGLLCSACNIGLGKFRDSTDFIKKALEYLENSVNIRK